MIEKLILPEIRELIEAGDLTTLGDVMNRWLPADLAGVVANLSEEEALKIVRLVEPPLSSEMFEYLEWSTQQYLLDELTEQESASLLEGMAADDRTALLEELPRERAERLIELLSPEQRAVARSLLQYSKDTVGRLMTPDFVAIRKEWTIKHVLDHVRTHGRDSETLNAIYVVDNANRLIDELRIREVLLAPLHAHVRDIMDNQFVALHATDDKKNAVEVFRKYDRTALPVIDSRGTLVGIVTIDDVLDIAEEEATREIQKFGGLEALDDPYIETPLASMVRKRATLAGHPVPERDAHGDGDGVLPGGDRQGGRPGAVRAADHLQRRQLGLAGRDPDHPGAGAGRGQASRLVAGDATGDRLGADARRASSGSIGFCGSRSGASFSRTSTPRTGRWSRLTVGLSLIGVVLWGTLSGSMLPFVAQAARVSTRPRPRRRSWRRWWT